MYHVYHMYDTRTPLIIHVNIPSLPCAISRCPCTVHTPLLYDITPMTRIRWANFHFLRPRPSHSRQQHTQTTKHTSVAE